MAFNINAFRNQLTRGGARGALFEVTITPPAALTLTRGNANQGEDYVRFMVKAAQLPESAIASIAVPYFGRVIKVPGNREPFADWTVTVINDENFAVRDMLEDWMSRINEHSANLRTAATGLSGHQGTGDILQYAKSGEVIKNVKMINMWPSNLGPISLAWDAGEIETYDVTFAYNWWEARTTDGQNSVVDSLAD